MYKTPYAFIYIFSAYLGIHPITMPKATYQTDCIPGKDNAIFVLNVAGLGFLGFVVSIGRRRRPIGTTNRKNPKPGTFQTKIAARRRELAYQVVRV